MHIALELGGAAPQKPLGEHHLRLANTAEPGPRHAEEDTVLLEVTDLKTQFETKEGPVTAVNGVSFSLMRGETLGIVGESGCGKSVTSLSIMRLIPKRSGRVVDGSVIYGGRDLLQISERDMRHIRGKEISMIFQEPMTALNPVLKIGQQIEETLLLHEDISRAEARRRTVENRAADRGDPAASRGYFPCRSAQAHG